MIFFLFYIIQLIIYVDQKNTSLISYNNKYKIFLFSNLEKMIII